MKSFYRTEVKAYHIVYLEPIVIVHLLYENVS